MISIIVCSVNNKLLNLLEKNINLTIGSDYEIIKINNSVLQMGICEAYNYGFNVAKGAIICFCHEDIVFENINWGIELTSILQNDETIGLVGVAGAIYKSLIPSPWMAIPSKHYRLNIQQKNNDGSIIKYTLNDCKLAEVAVLDGCFIAGRKAIFNQFPWNNDLLKKFHLYDLDISLRVGQFYKLVITDSISIIHLSEGNFDAIWLKESELFHNHYKKKFPFNVGFIKKKEIQDIEYFTLLSHIYTLKRLKQPLKKICFYYFKLFLFNPFKISNIFLLKYIIKTN